MSGNLTSESQFISGICILFLVVGSDLRFGSHIMRNLSREHPVDIMIIRANGRTEPCSTSEHIDNVAQTTETVILLTNLLIIKHLLTRLIEIQSSMTVSTDTHTAGKCHPCLTSPSIAVQHNSIRYISSESSVRLSFNSRLEPLPRKRTDCYSETREETLLSNF